MNSNERTDPSSESWRTVQQKVVMAGLCEWMRRKITNKSRGSGLKATGMLEDVPRGGLKSRNRATASHDLLSRGLLGIVDRAAGGGERKSIGRIATTKAFYSQRRHMSRPVKHW